jgi:hypothetical protein
MAIFSVFWTGINGYVKQKINTKKEKDPLIQKSMYVDQQACHT